MSFRERMKEHYLIIVLSSTYQRWHIHLSIYLTHTMITISLSVCPSIPMCESLSCTLHAPVPLFMHALTASDVHMFPPLHKSTRCTSHMRAHTHTHWTMTSHKKIFSMPSLFSSSITGDPWTSERAERDTTACADDSADGVQTPTHVTVGEWGRVWDGGRSVEGGVRGMGGEKSRWSVEEIDSRALQILRAVHQAATVVAAY